MQLFDMLVLAGPGDLVYRILKSVILVNPDNFKIY